jgi:transcriptional regulator with XRE-family HTH domain
MKPFQFQQTTPRTAARYDCGMAELYHDWYLTHWLRATDMTQARLALRTGWDKRKTSFLVKGRQEYRRQDVNDAAAALNIEPFELLMHPDDAMSLRRLRETGLRIASEKRDPWKPQKDDFKFGS